MDVIGEENEDEGMQDEEEADGNGLDDVRAIGTRNIPQVRSGGSEGVEEGADVREGRVGDHGRGREDGHCCKGGEIAWIYGSIDNPITGCPAPAHAYSFFGLIQVISKIGEN